MKSFIKLILFVFIFSDAFAASRAEHVVPVPRKITTGEGYFIFPSAITIKTKGVNKEINRFAVLKIVESLDEMHKINATVLNSDVKTEPVILLYENSRMSEDSLKMINGNKEEGYFLTVTPQQIIVEAPSSHGVFYGAMTAIQLLDRADDKAIQTCSIADYPTLEVRGISDDISRGQVSNMDNFKRIIRFMARYKLNTYQPYIEDVLKFDAFPSIGKNRGALTKDEVKELVSYSKNYFVEIIPIFQTLGHYENILMQPEFAKYSEYPGAASLNVSNDSIYIFLDKLLKEVCEIFPSATLHIGADESYDVGLGKSKSLVDQKGIARVHADHYAKIFALCRKYNRKVMMYGDILLEHTEILDMLPRDITIVNWDYADQFNFYSNKKIKDMGYNLIVSPAVWNFESSFPSYTVALPNIQYMIKSGIDNNAQGVITSQWGDYGAETFREFNLFGYAWTAQCAWSYEKNDLFTFSKDYFSDFFGANDSKFSRLYQYYSGALMNVLWHDIWQHPAGQFRESRWMSYSLTGAARNTFEAWTGQGIVELIKDLQKVAKRNTDHFDLLLFMNSLDKWYNLKVRTQQLLLDAQKDKPVKVGKLLELIDANLSQLDDLKSSYSKLWLRYNKPDNLKLIMDKFERLITYFKETKEKVKNEKYRSPMIDSKFIYAAESDSTLAKVAMFKKEFNSTQFPTKAWMQLIGDTYAKLYVNGKEAGEVMVTRTLSLTVEQQKVKLFDVTDLVKSGNNVIEVRAESFKKKNAGGCNVIGLIISPGEEIEIYSDDKWQAKACESCEWKRAVYNRNNYKVIAPNFSTGRASWIER